MHVTDSCSSIFHGLLIICLALCCLTMTLRLLFDNLYDSDICSTSSYLSDKFTFEVYFQEALISGLMLTLTYTVLPLSGQLC